MKKWFLLVLTILFVFAVAGCSSSGQTETASEQTGSVTESERQDTNDLPQNKDNSESSDENKSNSNMLVVYFSRTGEQYDVGKIDKGNTAIVAEMIADKTGADMFEILPIDDHYPMTYDALTDEICREHGISVIAEPEKGHGVSHFERDMQKEGKSWKDKLRNMLREIISYSRSFEDFLKNCADSGIEYVYTPQNKVKLKFRLRLSGEGQQRFTRADTLGDEFEPEAITKTIETAQKKADAAEQVEKFFAARRARRQAELAMLNQSSAKSAETKTAPSIPSTQPKPTESKAPEKKEDMWAAIRGMGRADEIIADLEAVGITSYTEFTGFMINSKHKDDHTDEVAELKAHIKTVETIIAKMKHRDELAPVYKEYKSKSGWAQSRQRKLDQRRKRDTLE